MTQTGSILAVDFGSVNTRVVLIDAVEGRYRLVSRSSGRTTDGYPANDITVGLKRVLREITDATGRQFMHDNGTIITPEQPDRSGADIFALTVSLGRPLRAVVVGLIPEVSIASAIRAASGTYIEIAETIHLEDGRTDEERLNAIVLSYPAVIIIVGGTEHGSTTAVMELAETTRFAVSLIDKSRRPSVIYSGNSIIADQVVELFSELTSALTADNLRPSLNEEKFDSARLQFGRAFDTYKENRSEDFAVIGTQAQTGVVSTGQGYSIIADYLGRITEGQVGLIDIGSSSSTLAVSDGERVITSIRTDVGLGHSTPVLLEAVTPLKLQEYIPFNITAAELRNHAMNKSLRPSTVPMNVRDLYIEQALLRAGAREMVSNANPQWRNEPLALSLLIAGGSALTANGHPGYDALLMLDCVQPSGVTFLQSDPFGLVPAMGAIATISPETVVHLLDGNNLVPIGTCISLSGTPRLDRSAMKVQIRLDDGTKINETVMGGHLWVYALPAGRSAEVKVSCQGGTSINGRSGVKLTVRGGSLGLLFDARGRPMMWPNTAKDRAALMPMWIHEVTGDPVIEIDPAWLDEVKEVAPTEDEKPSRRSRRDRRRRRRGRDQDDGDDGDFALPDDLASLLDDDDGVDNRRDDVRSADDELDELRNVLS